MHICKSDQRGPDCEIFIEVGPGRFVHRGTCRRQQLRHTSSPEYTQSLTEHRVEAHEWKPCSPRFSGSGQPMAPLQARLGLWSFLAPGVPSSASPGPGQVTRLASPGFCWARLSGGEGRPAHQSLTEAAGTSAMGKGSTSAKCPHRGLLGAALPAVGVAIPKETDSRDRHGFLTTIRREEGAKTGSHA